jgi:hypothetical protein
VHGAGFLCEEPRGADVAYDVPASRLWRRAVVCPSVTVGPRVAVRLKAGREGVGPR